MRYSLITVLATSAFVSSCGFSAEKCTQADWRAVGQTDGARGASVERLQSHVKVCSKHGVAVDQAAWNIGHAAGLKTYCTPQSAYRLGRNGRGLKSVCPDGDKSTLENAHAKGRRYYEISQEIDDLDREQAELKSEIRLALKTANSSVNTSWLRLKISQIDLKIWRLERERQAFAQL
jgi:hypothetical protein